MKGNVASVEGWKGRATNTGGCARQSDLQDPRAARRGCYAPCVLRRVSRRCGRPLVTLLGVSLATAALGGCGRPGARTGVTGNVALRAAGVGAATDPTVRGARLLPEVVREDRALGVEPGGGLRAIAAGLRVVSMPSGAVLASEERLPQPPAQTVALPERLGGGFLFVLGGGNLGSTLWRADRWLAEARPIHASTTSVQSVLLGLDRVYLRASNGAVAAMDGRTGARLDLGPWPGSPFVGRYVAADGWRAVAVNDLRGAVATFDAGATWRPLALPLDVKNVQLHGDAIAVGGYDAAREEVWYEVRPDGQVGRLGAAAASSSPPPPPQGGGEEPAEKPGPDGARPLGKRPLVAALEDGWPLEDGTAVVARDGALARVRLGDGALIEHVPDAFRQSPSRCHPIALPTDAAPGGFGFVCGEVRGPTVLYAYDARRGALSEQWRFERPRAILGFGNGAVAARGACDPYAEESGAAAPPSTEHGERAAGEAYCVRPRVGAPYSLPVTGTTPGDRLVVLADGGVAVISVPHGDLDAARLTLKTGAQMRTVPIVVRARGADPAAPLAAEVARALRLGVWLDGWEERRPGVLGGWVDAGGTVLGLEIALDGKATHGPYIHDAGAPMVSGRYGLGWAASRRGVETTDGGLTWTPVELPDMLVPPRAATSRACGPIGCSAAGWLRVGWGPPRHAPAPELPAPTKPKVARPSEPLQLVCEPVMPAPPPVPEARRAPTTPEPSARGSVTISRGSTMPLPSPWGGAVLSILGGASGMDLPAFYVTPPPTLHPDERGITVEAGERLERAPRTGPLARAYAWGPRTGEWEHAGRWLARWVSPFGGWNEVRSSAIAQPPQLLLDAARFTSPSAVPVLATWQLGASDDGAHALLAARKSSGRGFETTLFELEEGRAPVEVRRADGEALGELESSVRMGGRWYVATPPGTEWTSVILQLEGASARELARIPRAGMDSRPTGARLARRSDGRALGFVVDGQPTPDRPGPQRWVLPVDVETGAPGEPEPLGAADLGDRGAVPLCGEDDAGWVLDMPWNLGARLQIAGKSAGALATTDARVRVSAGGAACVERLAGTMGALGGEQTAALVRVGGVKAAAPGSIPVVVISTASRTQQMRYPLRCTAARGPEAFVK